MPYRRPEPAVRRPMLHIAPRLSVGAMALAVLLWWLEPAAVAAAFGPLSAAWVGLALALGVPQVLLSAWRWRLTALRLGLALPLGRAFGEYYLATFLNQVLPGGVAGDLNRAWRHMGAGGGGPATWHAVLIERVSGQLALALVAVAAVGLSQPLRAGMGAALGGGAPPMAAWMLGGLALGAAGAWCWRAPLLALWRNLRRALLAPGVLPLQLLGSLAVVSSYVIVYFCCARAIGNTLPAAQLLPLIPPVLLAMAVPLSMAGWGVREGAAALVWLLVGLPPAEGVAISVAYGLVVLVSSLPGALILLVRGTRPAFDLRER